MAQALMQMDHDIVDLVERLKSKQCRTVQTSGKDRQTAGKTTEQDLREAGIYERFKDVSFSSLKGVEGSIRDNAKLVFNYAKHIDKHMAAGTGLILSGNYGTMKTTLAVCVLKYYMEQGGKGLFIPMCSLMDSLYTMKARNVEEWSRFEMRIRNTGLLVIDDLGGEDTGAPWVASKVNSIITERYNRKKPIIITTNLTQQELEGTYPGRLLDRLRSTSYYLSFTADSKRKTLDIKDLQN